MTDATRAKALAKFDRFTQKIGHPDKFRDYSKVDMAALLTPSERHQLIAEAAYLIAKRRGFSPGEELSDWLAAEEEVDRACGLIEPSPRWD